MDHVVNQQTVNVVDVGRYPIVLQNTNVNIGKFTRKRVCSRIKKMQVTNE